jgi:hypothetical protein
MLGMLAPKAHLARATPGNPVPWKLEIVKGIFGPYVVRREDDYGFMRLNGLQADLRNLGLSTRRR